MMILRWKVSVYYLLLGVLAQPLAAAPSQNAQKSAPVKICYEYNAQPPYTFGENSIPDKDPGLLVELIEKVFFSLPYEVSFYRRSWKRCMEDLKVGHADATFAMIWTTERERWARFPKTAAGQLDPARYLWSGTYKIFVHPDSSLGWDGTYISNLKLGIGAPLGYISYQRLQALNALSQMNVDQQTGLQLVANQRMDGYVIDQEIGIYQTRNLGLEGKLTSLEVPFLTSFWYLPFSQKYYQQYPGRVEQIWHALERTRTKEKSDLLSKYLH